MYYSIDKQYKSNSTYLRNVGDKHNNKTVNEREQRWHTSCNTNNEENDGHDNSHTRDNEHESFDFDNESRLSRVTQ